MTQQEAFDKVWQWFVVEGHGKSMTADRSSCAYRGEGGRKCAIGVLLSDESCARILNNMAVDASPQIRELSELQGLGLPFLRDLQQAHDCTAYAEHFTLDIKQRLTKLAATYGLIIPIAT